MTAIHGLTPEAQEKRIKKYIAENPFNGIPEPGCELGIGNNGKCIYFSGEKDTSGNLDCKHPGCPHYKG